MDRQYLSKQKQYLGIPIPIANFFVIPIKCPYAVLCRKSRLALDFQNYSAAVIHFLECGF